VIRQLLLIAVAAALMACGNQEAERAPVADQPPASEAQAPSVAAPPPLAPAAPEAAPAMPSAPAEAVTPPESAQCLELVGRSAFAEAVPVCVRAAGLDPDNAAVQQALETARSKAATAAAAEAGGAGAAEAVPEGAAGSLGDKMP
jgi:2-oxoglutarate dehydrogenase E2 component (dihydrolipoamide succinyltransferase)